MAEPTGDVTAETETIAGLSQADTIAMFRGLAVGSPDGIIVADTGGVVMWANHAAEVVFGFPDGGMTGRPVTELVPDSLAEEARRLRREVLEGKPVSAFETQGVRADGTRFPFSLTPAVCRSPEGRVLGLSAIVRDLSRENRVRRALTEALARSRARFDQVAMPQALLDLEARFVEVNDAACRLLGRSRDQLVGVDARTILEPVDVASTQADLGSLLTGRLDSVAVEALATRAEGVRVPVKVDVSVVRDDHDEPSELALFLADLTAERDAQRRLQAQNAFFSNLYRRAADPAMVIDVEGRIGYVSPSFTEVLGYSADNIMGRNAFELLHPDQEASARQVLAGLVPRHGATERLLVRGLDQAGEWHWFDAVATNCLDDPGIDGLIVNLREVTAEIDARDDLRRSEARYRTIVETAQEGILAIDPTGAVAFANQKAADILGLDLDVLYAEGVLGRLTDEQRAELLSRLASRAETGAETFEVVYPHPARGPVIIEVAASPLIDDDGKSMGSLTMIADVTTERQVADDLRHQALHDSLTGLPNRSLLVDRLAMASARQLREHQDAIAVLFLDLDHFKLVNDSLGHAAGDRLLVEVAARLEAAVRETDTVARLGGDEFAVVCEESSPEEAEAVAQRIQEALQEPVYFDGEPVRVSASIGVALSPPHHSGDLLRFADTAMYESKASGRSRVTSFDASRTDMVERRGAVLGALQAALESETLPLEYQPIVGLASRRLLGLEALVRWNHSDLGPITREEVVIAADTGGLAYELDRALVRTAARDLVRLREEGAVADSVFVSVNVSARTTQQQRLEDLVSDTLVATGVPAPCLALEITEHAIMDNAEHAVATLNRLAETGVVVCIDEFGTGYNSLVQLQRLPLGSLKIDRSFVARLHDDHASRVITQSIVGLAAALGLQTIAEGVETPGQLSFLRGIGCHAGQGGLWMPAAPVQDLGVELRRLGL